MTEANHSPSSPKHGDEFIKYLELLADRDRGAMAALRRSLGFEPGAYPAAFPYVERFVPPECHAMAPYRRALYLVAGLFARHPTQRGGQSLATAFGRLRAARDSASIEKRFVALLAADAESLAEPLRQAVSLLAADDIPFDYARLLSDLVCWLDPFAHERLDGIRQRWARDFYRVLAPREDAGDSQQSSHPNHD